MSTILRTVPGLIVGSLLLLLLVPSFSQAASARIFGAMGQDCCSSETGVVTFADYATNQIIIDVRASAYSASQNGGGRGFSGSAETTIGSLQDTDDQTVGSDPMNVRSMLLMTVTRNQAGNWIGEAAGFGPTDLSASVPVSANAGASGEDSMGSSDVSAWVYWIEAAGGVITTTANIPTASWVITGPETITGSGSSANYTNKPAGTYTITWGAVPGYGTPASVTRTLSNGGSISFPMGVYVAPSVEVNFQQ